ncbi:hypothetical protein DACRYDRAFT_117719 [Dacryopinax primogenitus]|uniref:Glycosyltransferase family 1 protein n=1 Tax=Dacryopinax primogenitus (strain DJM 731) TaxID=1858805 RepID=M5FR14_DACPD|nr:uncharacterized protein DACRYDRAFT_117719 [Dacryopinax primogenitus]EJT99475.1 hypothetical protein DACRYDRAFT_117719 [Dacryopinax primogenitus]
MQRGSLPPKQRGYLAVCCIVIIICILWFYRNQVLLEATASYRTSLTSTPTSLNHTSLSSLRVAVVEQEEFHNEVLGAVLSDLLRLGVRPQVYRSVPYLYRFGDVLQRFYPYGFDQSIVKNEDTGVFQPGPVEDAIRAGEYDLVILNSCHWAIWWETNIFMALNSSDAHVICILHTPHEEGIGKARFQYSALGAQGRFTGLSLSTHTQDAAMKLFDKWADKEHDRSWDKIPVEYFVPIFPAISDPQAIHKSRIPSKFVIQGSIDTLRRNYDGLIAELLQIMKADLHSWGYYQEKEGSPFLPLKKPAHGAIPPPFNLHLIGHSIREPKIPDEMVNVVHIRDSPDFEEFYGTLAEMDVLIPAFSADLYLTAVASSSIPAAVMTRTPILASPAHLRAYGYLAPPAVIVRPSSMSDAEAISRLRAGLPLLEDTAIQGNRFDLPEYRDWDAYTESLLQSNTVTWRRILARAIRN